LALAPSYLGPFSGDLLVGNFGDGRINAFDIKQAVLSGQLDSNGIPITIEGLWGSVRQRWNGERLTSFLRYLVLEGQIEDHGLSVK
jgi:hypothetical protein